MSNKFLVKFPPLVNQHGIMFPNWLPERLELEVKVTGWCEERISIERGFPKWDFQYGNYYYPDHGHKPVPTGVFIFSEEARTAFRLTFGM